MGRTNLGPYYLFSGFLNNLGSIYRGDNRFSHSFFGQKCPGIIARNVIPLLVDKDNPVAVRIITDTEIGFFRNYGFLKALKVSLHLGVSGIKFPLNRGIKFDN